MLLKDSIRGRVTNMGDYLNLDVAFYDGVGKYQFPEVYPCIEQPDVDSWIQFNYAKTTLKKKERTGVNFYIKDQQFERVWNNPLRYAELLSDYGCVTGPDFSTYLDFPLSVRLYNTYRNRWLTRYWQENGVNVVPDVGWGLEDSYEWCFDGLPEDSIVSVSNVGAMDNAESRKAFMRGYNEMLIRLQPRLVLFYANKIDDYKGNIRFIKFRLGKGDYKLNT